MSDELPLRGGRTRRRPGRRRASGGFSPRRALAALAMLAAAGAVWGALASPAFEVTSVEVEGATLTGTAAVRAALELPDPAPNAFTIATDDLRRRVIALPAVADAEVRVDLPGSLRVRVVERDPVLAWRRDGGLYLVDRDGRVLADAARDPAAAVAAAGLPLVADRRTEGPRPAVGDLVDGLDLLVATSLLSLTPADVGSAAPALLVAVDDRDGWTVLPAVDDPWVAVFGFYGPEVRKAAMIPEQVRTLRLLLAGREAQVARALLAGPRTGTFIEKAPAP